MANMLVTGGAGFIGSNLVDALIGVGHRVIVIDNLSTGKEENLNKEAEFHNADISNLDQIRPLFNGVDFVFHLAAMARMPLTIEKPIESNMTNINGTLNVLFASHAANVKKVIFSSSCSVYGEQEESPVREDMICNPLSPYGLQKLTGERYCKLFSVIYNLPTVCLRYSSVYGPRQSMEGTYMPVISIFLGQKERGEPLTITGDGGQTRDFTHVSDVVRANILAVESGSVGRADIVNIAGGKEYSIRHLAEMISDKIEYQNKREGDIYRNLVDITLAKKILGWEPEYDLESGLEDLMKNNLK